MSDAPGDPVASPSQSVLSIATVSQSLVFQAPAAWDVLLDMGLSVTFAAAQDKWTPRLSQWGNYSELNLSRRPSLNNLTGLGSLRTLLSRDWAMVQVQSPIASALTRLALPARRSYPLLYVSHGFHFQKGDRNTTSAGFERVESLLARRRTDALALVAGEDHDWATQHVGDACRVYRLPGAGVDVERFASAEPTEKPGSPLFVFCGELNDNKDPDWAVDVSRRLRSTYPQLHLLVIGDGPKRARLAELAQHESWLTWLPFSSDVDRHLRTADCLLAPSRREGLPRVIIEAMAAGTPVVARSNRGSRELLRDVGTVVADGASLAEWCQAVTRLLERPTAEADLQATAQQYSLGAFRDSYRATVQELLFHTPRLLT